jgi:hypothetical protein
MWAVIENVVEDVLDDEGMVLGEQLRRKRSCLKV